MTEKQLARILIGIAERLSKEVEPTRPAPKKAALKKGEAKTWVLKAGVRGRAPNWVLAMTGLKTKPELVAKFGDGHTFNG